MPRLGLLVFACLALLSARAVAQPAPQACAAAVTVSPSIATDTQIVALSAGKNIFICGIEASSSGTNDFYLESATAASCGGTLTQIGTEYYTAADWLKTAGPYLPGLSTGTGNALCVHTTAAEALSLTVWYAQYP
jgi:hypothetical protein